MRRRIYDRITITDSILEHTGKWSIAVSVIITAGCFISPIGRMRLIPHIITYASCNLALIGFIFSIILGLRGGDIYNKLSTKFPGKVSQIYRKIYRITIASSATALIAMLVLSIDKWFPIMKWALGYVLCCVFTYMVLGTILIFKILVELMTKDDEKRR